MSPAGDAPNVTASGGSHGAEAGTIHGGVHNYYQVPANATPEEKFDYALRYLASGQATTARRLLGEVVLHLGGRTDVWFHWLLAFFSGRTLWELPPEDQERLRSAREQIAGLTRDDRWSRGIAVIEQLVDVTLCRAAHGAVSSAALRAVDRLDTAIRRDVLRHLERMLQGRLKDELWEREVDLAIADRRFQQVAVRPAQ